MNFLKETLDEIRLSGHKDDDVLFVGSKDGKYRINLDKFKDIADIEYDNGLGGERIPADLIIYFRDGSFCVRRSYDGSEWWEYIPRLQYGKEDSFDELPFIPMNSSCYEGLEKALEEHYSELNDN